LAIGDDVKGWGSSLLLPWARPGACLSFSQFFPQPSQAVRNWAAATSVRLTRQLGRHPIDKMGKKTNTTLNLPLFDVPLSHSIMRPSIAVPQSSVLQTS
jgi:hypothetical protein